MKPKILFISLLIISTYCYSQNLQDAYEHHQEPVIDHWPKAGNDLTGYTGEYQIFLDKFFWEANSEFDASVSFSIEVVSFPFIPDEINPDQDNPANSFNNRTLSSDFITDENNTQFKHLSSQSSDGNYEGVGWEYGDYHIYKKIININTCDKSGQDYICWGDYDLISMAYYTGIQANWYNDCHFPHTILKHTLYFHCGDSTTSILDSLSWLYDNTRGMMNRYPFSQTPTTKAEERLDPSVYDVVFRPSFARSSGPYTYTDTSNSSWYDSGWDSTMSTGSVNYFPAEELQPFAPFTICQPGEFKLYCEGDTCLYYAMTCNDTAENGFHSYLVHPPPFVLLDAPLLNHSGRRYAGYKNTGYQVDSNATPHRYEIKEPFDLTIINPSERIIYNPSEVHIYCDLTFPCHYKFLTLHGKYPDKELEVLNGQEFSSEYWEGNPYYRHEFDYNKDYPVPVNCSTNSECKSYYVIHGGHTITLEPETILMDIVFEGKNYSNKARIKYDSNYTFGNWQHDTATIDLEYVDYSDINFENCTQIHEGGGLKSGITSNPVQDKNLILIKNNATHNPIAEFDIGTYPNIELYIYDMMGKLIHQDRIKKRSTTFYSVDLDPGIYNIILSKNGKIYDRERLCKTR